jgi:hypothetical protein
MDADADTDTSRESPSSDGSARTKDETWNYLERLERRAQMRKIRRTPVPDEAQPEREGEDFL